MKEWMVEGWFQKKGWNPWPHGLLGNPPLSPELCALVARWNVLSAGGRTLSFKRGLRKTHCPANQHLNWSVFTLTFTITATDTSPTLDCVNVRLSICTASIKHVWRLVFVLAHPSFLRNYVNSVLRTTSRVCAHLPVSRWVYPTILAVLFPFN